MDSTKKTMEQFRPLAPRSSLTPRGPRDRTCPLRPPLSEKLLIDFDLPYEDWHGQHVINFRHPNFSRQDSTRIINQAFQAEFDQLSSSMYRMFDTAMRGYRTMSASSDPWLRRRGDQMRGFAEQYRLLAPTMRRFAHNRLERERVTAAEREATRLFGAPSAKVRALQIAARAIAEAHSITSRWFGNMPQPRTRLERFRWPDGAESTAPMRADGKTGVPIINDPVTPVAAGMIEG